jgi:hypothetical protein
LLVILLLIKFAAFFCRLAHCKENP